MSRDRSQPPGEPPREVDWTGQEPDDDGPAFVRRRPRRDNSVLIGAGVIAGLMVALLAVIGFAVSRHAGRQSAPNRSPDSVPEVHNGQVPLPSVAAPVSLPGIVADPDEPRLLAVKGHPWWAGHVTPGRVEQLVAAVTDRSQGILFFNRVGDIYVCDSTTVLQPVTRDRDTNLAMMFAVADQQFRIADRLRGTEIKAVVLWMRPGDRVSRSKAIAIVQDSLRMPSYEDTRRESDRANKAIEDLQGVDLTIPPPKPSK